MKKLFKIFFVMCFCFLIFDVEAKVSVTNNKEYNEVVGSEYTFSVTSTKYDLSKDYIYVGTEVFDLAYFNYTDEVLKVEDNKLNIYYNDELVKSYFLIIINTDYNIIEDLYFSVGIDDPNNARFDLTYGTQKVENNKLYIYYEEDLLDYYEIISVHSDYYDLSKEYIYIDEEPFNPNKISVYNASVNYNASTGEYNVSRQVSNLPIGNIFFSIKIVSYSSNYYDLSKDYIYTGTYNYDSGYLKLTNVSDVVEDNKLKLYYEDTLLKEFDLISLKSDTVIQTVESVLTPEKFLYIRSNNLQEPLRVINGTFKVVDDQLTIYHGDDVVVVYTLASILSNDYNLTDYTIMVINQEFDISKIQALNCTVERVDNYLQVRFYFNDGLEYHTADSYNLFVASSDYYDLTKDFIFLGEEFFDISKITVSVGSVKSNTSQDVSLYSSTGYVFKQIALVRLDRTAYDIIDNCVYLEGREFNPDYFHFSSAITVYENDKINLYYDGELIHSYDTCNISSSKYDLNKKYIYLSDDEFDLNDIVARNCEVKVEENNLNIYRNGTLLGSYSLVSITSPYLFEEDYVYIGTNTFKYSDVVVTNGKYVSKIGDEKVSIEVDGEIIKSYYIISVGSNKYDEFKYGIYVGNNRWENKDIISTHGTLEFDGNNIYVYFKKKLLDTLKIVSISSDTYNFYNDYGIKYTYSGTVLPEDVQINVVNGTQKIENNYLNIYYEDILLDSYEICYFKSDYYDLSKGYIFVGNGEIDLTKFTSNAVEIEYQYDTLNIIYHGSTFDNYDVIKVYKPTNVFIDYQIYDDYIYVGELDISTGSIKSTWGTCIVNGNYLEVHYNGEIIFKYLIKGEIRSIDIVETIYEFQLKNPSTYQFNPVIELDKYIYDKTLYWSSSDETVAKVDNGVVTPVGVGQAIISVSTVNGKNDTVTINVYGGEISYNSKDYVGIFTGFDKTINLDVLLDGADVIYSLDGVNYNLEELPKFVYPGKYTIYYKITADYYEDTYGSNYVSIFGITQINDILEAKENLLIFKLFKPTFSDLKTRFEIFSEIAYYFLHLDKDKNEVDSDVIKTGDNLEIKFENEEEATYKYQLATLGDIDGDGDVTPLDYVKIKNHIMGTTLIEEGASLSAADANSDNEISPLDYVKVKNYIMNGEN